MTGYTRFPTRPPLLARFKSHAGIQAMALMLIWIALCGLLDLIAQ